MEKELIKRETIENALEIAEEIRNKIPDLGNNDEVISLANHLVGYLQGILEIFEE